MKRIAALSALVFLTACTRLAELGFPTAGPSLSPLPPVARADRIVQVVDRVRPAVVSVTSQLASAGSLVGDEGEGSGTGFVVQADGVVVTNYHVVEGALNLEVVTAEGEELPARVIGGDPNADLAVLKVQAEDLATVELGSSSSLRLGESVIALGFALALEGGPSVTSGIISAMDRTITAGDSQGNDRTYEDLLQTDAAINPGNSGGPLVDLNGRVVGINTAGVGAGNAENIGFAIAIDRAKDVISRAIDNPAAAEPYMGITTRTIDAVLAAQLDLPVDVGALILDVAPDGPAEDAGIEPGDTLIRIEDDPITSDEDVRDALSQRKPGERISISVVHTDGSPETLTVRLGVRPLPIPAG